MLLAVLCLRSATALIDSQVRHRQPTGENPPIDGRNLAQGDHVRSAKKFFISRTAVVLRSGLPHETATHWSTNYINSPESAKN